MEAPILGLVIDSGVLIETQRAGLTTPEAIRQIRAATGDWGDLPIAVCALTVAELAHGIYRAKTPAQAWQRRQYLDELKVPVHPVTEVTAEIIARVGSAQAAQGINLPLGDLIIGASALELGYAVATKNVRDFERIPGLRIVRF